MYVETSRISRQRLHITRLTERKQKQKGTREREKKLPQHQIEENGLIFFSMNHGCPEKINHSHGRSVLFK